MAREQAVDRVAARGSEREERPEPEVPGGEGSASREPERQREVGYGISRDAEPSERDHDGLTHHMSISITVFDISALLPSASTRE